MDQSDGLKQLQIFKSAFEELEGIANYQGDTQVISFCKGVMQRSEELYIKYLHTTEKEL